jgi:hypothetical protein
MSQVQRADPEVVPSHASHGTQSILHHRAAGILRTMTGKGYTVCIWVPNPARRSSGAKKQKESSHRLLSFLLEP